MPEQRSHIRFAVDVLRRLGEELNTGIDQGVIELVKNAYDADATWCRVELHDIDAPGGSIVVTDNGNGMLPQDITNGWLVLGRSNKNPTERTRLGRLPAGSKGLGRLAALRLGEHVSLRTWPKGHSVQYNLEIDWKAFDSVDLVEQVSLSVHSQPPTLDTHGTRIVVSKLNTRVSRQQARRLARSLVLLSSPFDEDEGGFHPTLEGEGYADLVRMVGNRYFGEADFHLRAFVDSAGIASAIVTDRQGETLYEGEHSEIRKGNANPFLCPTTDFDFWVFLLDSENWGIRSATLNEAKEWLGHFGGTHLYFNGLRVAPYGEPGDDWLGINASRARNPEERPSTNTSIGRLKIADIDQKLKQKTDRSGLIENDSFEQLRAFAFESLEWMARQRLATAQRRRKAAKETASRQLQGTRQRVTEAVSTIATLATGGIPNQRRVPQADVSLFQAELESSIEELQDHTEQQIEVLRKEVQLYRTLATAGIVASTFSHEAAGGPLKLLTITLPIVERRAATMLGSDYEAKLGESFQEMRKAVRDLGVLGSLTLGLLRSDKRRTRVVDLRTVAEATARMFTDIMNRHDVVIALRMSNEKVLVKSSIAALEAIISNFLTNAVKAFEHSENPERLVQVEVLRKGAVASLIVSDNGPGIEGALDEIWLPGVSTNRGGTGLGLAIVSDVVSDLGGTVTAEPHGSLGGAEFHVNLAAVNSND
ncbi:ATP-binding protein [Catellatospora citrea]|uniref:ATP-binding protein n=1 Tax=Catellatospora citrea TaxID=53366 RepID=UPI0033E1F11C